MAALRNSVGRLLVIAIALCSASWAAFFLDHTDQAVQLNGAANAVLSGAAFQRNPAAESSLVSAETRAICNPLEVRAAAIIRLRLYEMAVDALDTRQAEERLRSLRSSVKRALNCVPTDGFLWFMQYWSAINQGGQVTDHLEDLRLSYELAPFEGWIALRSPYVLAIYDILPDDLKKGARNEFVAIVRTGLIRDAVKILKGPGWRNRDSLVAGLTTVRLEFRLRLDRALRAENLIVEIPGIEPQEFRPWR